MYSRCSLWKCFCSLVENSEKSAVFTKIYWTTFVFIWVFIQVWLFSEKKKCLTNVDWRSFIEKYHAFKKKHEYVYLVTYKLFIENINLIFLFILVKIWCLVIAMLLIRSINKLWPAISYATSEISSRDEFWRESRIR